MKKLDEIVNEFMDNLPKIEMNNKIMEEEYQLNIDEVLYLQMIIQQNLDDEYIEDDEVYRNMIIKLQNKMCLIKNELNK